MERDIKHFESKSSEMVWRGVIITCMGVPINVAGLCDTAPLIVRTVVCPTRVKIDACLLFVYVRVETAAEGDK